MEQSLDEQREIKFMEALGKSYAGCMFDIDGTLTVRGEEFIPAFMHGPLAQMGMRIPMAICTARKLQHAYEKIAPVFTRASNPLYCQSNWIMICENGSIGYFFDAQSKEYKEFFRVPWPYDESHRERLFGVLNSKLQGKLGTSFTNVLSLVFRPVAFADTDRSGVASRSREIAEIIYLQLDIYDPKRLLKIGDSGIGVSVFPMRGDKENGTREFARYLREIKGLTVSADAKDLVLVGDQPGPFGNDEVFLNGNFGMPFTVGEVCPDRLLPLPVYDSAGKVVTGPEGTLILLQQLKFRNDFALS